jgi:hypothetical protein
MHVERMHTVALQIRDVPEDSALILARASATTLDSTTIISPAARRRPLGCAHHSTS